MKNYFTLKLALLALVLFGWSSNMSAEEVNYQTVKHWNFLTWSDATIANLAADVTNWEVASTDSETGAVQRYKSKVANATTLSANGVEIEETKGIGFPSLSAGNINLRFNFTGNNGIQLGSSNQKVTIKSLKKDQKVIVALRGAGSGSRGISAISSNLSGIIGESTYSLDGADVTYEFTVTADGDATFTYSGGIILQDIKLQEVATAPKKVAYIYETGYSTTWNVENDPIHLALKEAYSVTDIAYPKTSTEVSTVVDAAIQEILDANYDLVVIAEAIGGTNSYGLKLESIVGKVPMLNMKSFFYRTSSPVRWPWGTGVNPATTGTTAITVENAYNTHPIFDGVTIAADGTCEIFGTSVPKNNQMQAYSAPTTIIAGDPILAKIGDLYAIHEHVSVGEAIDYRYILIPISSDALIGNFSDNGLKLVMNTAKYLSGGDYIVYAEAEKPVISSAQNDKVVTVTITSATADASIYYSIDGSTPNESSTLYTSAFDISKPCTVKAIAIKEKMKNSEVASLDIENPNYAAREKTLLWANFKDQPEEWGIDGDIFNGTSGENVYAGFKVGSNGQRVNIQKTGVSEVVGDTYGPATEADAGATAYAMSFLKGEASGYMISPSPIEGPFDVALWWCNAKDGAYTEKLKISIKTESASEWIDLGTVSTSNTKKIVKQTIAYDGTDAVLVKVTSASTNGANNNAMIFDWKLLGEGKDETPDGIADNDIYKVVVSKEYYDIMGKKLSTKPVNTIAIEKVVYEDGTSKFVKVRYTR